MTPLAERIFKKLVDKGAELGDASILIIDEAINEYEFEPSKHIFVTMDEFIQNDGILSKDRQIFRKIYGTESEFQHVGYYIHQDGDLHIIHTGTASHPAAMTAFYVQIKVTPIWK